VLHSILWWFQDVKRAQPLYLDQKHKCPESLLVTALPQAPSPAHGCTDRGHDSVIMFVHKVTWID
jgi:hypothetical protein